MLHVDLRSVYSYAYTVGVNNYFSSSPGSPYHISVGAILINDTGQVACHHFEQVTDDQTGIEFSDFYILMRESLELNETLEQALARGLMEEFGATGKIVDFVGTVLYTIPRSQHIMYKTTLYFIVTCTSFDPTMRRPDDPEKDSKIEWHDIDYLIKKVSLQTKTVIGQILTSLRS